MVFNSGRLTKFLSLHAHFRAPQKSVTQFRVSQYVQVFVVVRDFGETQSL